MKQLFFLIALAVVLTVGYFTLGRNKANTSDSRKKIENRNLVPTTSPAKKALASTSLFIPAWSVKVEGGLDQSMLNSYDRLIYFGITPTLSGINKNEAGYLTMDEFLEAVSPGKKKYLALRMMSDSVSLPILRSPENQQKIIEETLQMIEQKNFDGLVLDLEVSYSLDESLKGQINNFVQLFYSEAKKHYIPFSLAIYGDVFYRGRLYDVSFLGNHSDEIMVMAYDFHKSRGEPGPNFPLSGKEKYQYDFKEMVQEFAAVVPKEKLTVIFGMYGYDWGVDEKKRPYKQASSLSLNEIRKKFIESGCQEESCVVKRDDESGETEINYVVSASAPDEQGIYRIDYHIVWFEDEASAKAKTDFLLQNGINKIAYWAYGYF